MNHGDGDESSKSSKSSILKLGNLGCYDLPQDKGVFLGLKLLWPAASRRPSAMDGNTCHVCRFYTMPARHTGTWKPEK